MRSYQPWDSVNIMAIVAAVASLNDPQQVENGRRLNSEAKIFVTGELNTMGYQSIPSQANFFMVDVKRSVVPLIQAMKQQNVEVGRLFPAMPNLHARYGRQEKRDGKFPHCLPSGGGVMMMLLMIFRCLASEQ